MLEPLEAVRFLQERTGKQEPLAAAAICRELGNLPLALEHAAAYVLDAVIGLAVYLERLRTRGKKLRGPVASSVGLSIDRLTKESSGLLERLAFLAPEDIPRDVFGEEDDEAFAGLRRHSLISTGADAFRVHRLVQAVVRDGLAERRAGQAEEVVKWMNRVFPFVRDKNEIAAMANRTASSSSSSSACLSR
ncbi:MAG: hypothetical protein FJW20_13835 [Acidimicrobiia bacterium]|nr:hypothetical protein [Acidimicrobiia bacterium]